MLFLTVNEDVVSGKSTTPAIPRTGKIVEERDTVRDLAQEKGKEDMWHSRQEGAPPSPTCQSAIASGNLSLPRKQ